MSTSRLLTREERRLLADALRNEAADARRAKSFAAAHPVERQGQVDELARRASNCDRLAAEIVEHEVRIERVVS